MSTIEQVPPNRVLSDVINPLFSRIELPNTNQPVEQRLLSDLFLTTLLVKRGTSDREKIIDKLKDQFSEKIKELPTNVDTTLFSVTPFTLSVKKSSARKTFDLSTFIKVVADKYNISASELLTLSDTTLKDTNPATSFTVSLT